MISFSLCLFFIITKTHCTSQYNHNHQHYQQSDQTHQYNNILCLIKYIGTVGWNWMNGFGGLSTKFSLCLFLHFTTSITTTFKTVLKDGSTDRITNIIYSMISHVTSLIGG